MYMKKYIFLAASALTLASCSSDDFLGDTPGNVQSNTSAINFDGGTGKISRATLQSDKAAEALNNNYVVYGYKTAQDNSTTTVFDHYTIHWNNQAGKTESNTCGWEYVGQKANSLSKLPGDKDQTIKYWDYSASQYDFVAFSFGEANQGEEEGKVKATAVTTTPKLSYTLTGAVDDLEKCFIADRITAKPTVANNKNNLLVGYKDNVQFNFRSLSTKVTMGIYETVPGYSVKNVVFYSADNIKATDNKPTLYATDKKIPAGNGTVTVTFPTDTETESDYNKAHVKFTAATGSEKSSSIQFETLSTVEREKQENTTTGFIGRDITTFSTPKKDDGKTKVYEVVIPANVGDLTLKVDYTLESIDGSGETITVTGATAVVPGKYTNWEPNYAYTYIFKISDKTNGSTGTPGTNPAGLYPITFDAIVTETETGKQETITTVDKNSITTYAKDEINNEYKKDANIYVSVNNTTDLHINRGNEEDTTPTNVKLYTATGTGSYEKNITEATVALCLSKGTTTNTTDERVLSVDDNNKLTVTPANGLTIVQEIAADDAVDGNAISGNFAMFKPTNAGTYVFEFTDTKNKNTKYYKVIIVK